MPKLRRYRIFISHAWSYDEYERVKYILDTERNFSYSDYSVPRSNSLVTKSSRQLGEALKRLIRPCHIVLVVGGMEVNYRNVIQFELNFAQELGKPIIMIIPRGALRLPRTLLDMATDVAGWNKSSIVKKIRKYAL